MWVPLVVLAVLSVVGGYVGVPPALSSLVGIHGENRFEHFLEPAIGKATVTAAPSVSTPVHESTAVAGEPATSVAPESTVHSGHDVSGERLFTGVSILIALVGLGLGWVMFTRDPLKSMPRLLENKYYVDEVYDAAVITPIENVSRGFLWKVIDVRVIDGIVNGVASLFGELAQFLRLSQTGSTRGYAAAILVGAIALLGFFALR